MIRYKVSSVTVPMIALNSINLREFALIMEKDSETGVWLPSSLSHYIYAKHGSHSINTQKKWAYLICDFMNFLLEQVALREERIYDCLKSDGLYGLNFKHGASFIHYLSNDKANPNNYDTVKEKEDELIRFYDFLYNFKITNGEDMKVSYSYRPKKNPLNNRTSKPIKLFINPFENCGISILYPIKDGHKIGVLKDMPESHWNLLLEVAEDKTPDIELGVAMQIMGGIRVGEAVNQTLYSYKKERDKLILNIKDRQEQLFWSRGIKTETSQVKVQRDDQIIFNFNGELLEILDRHLDRLKKMPMVNTEALFVDSKGNAMTGEIYRTRFAYLKECFLRELGGNQPSEEKKYRVEYKWGTHIGRHIFTNYCITHGKCSDALGKPSPRILANLRGDSNIESAMVYIDALALARSNEERIEVLSRLAVEADYVED